MQKRAERELRESLRKVRRLSSHLETVRERERTTIAREVHDQLGHALTALKMEAAWLARKLPSGDAKTDERARSMKELIDRTIATVRRISTELRPGILDDLGLAAAVEWQAEDFGQRTGLTIHVETPRQRLDLPPDLATAAFRIFQEALTNVTRHAEAKSVRIELGADRKALRLLVADDGKGLDGRRARRVGSFGLIGMEEALERYGLSAEEFDGWRSAVSRHGLDGLKVTALQRYRQP